MKKAVSFILAAIMLIMLPAGAFADSAQCSCDTPPVVMVNGFGTELYHDNGDGTQSAVFPMGAVEIVSAIPSLPAHLRLSPQASMSCSARYSQGLCSSSWET